MDEEVANDLNLLVTWMIEIGQHRGAKERYVRFENDANTLPPPAQIMAELGDNYCRLRLYCIRLTDEVIILANGGLKTGRTVRDSPELLVKFRFANKMANQLLKLIQSNQLLIDGKSVINLEEIELLD